MDRNLLLPAVLGGFLICSLCFYEQVYLRDYWSEPGVEAALMGDRFKAVPKEIGDWVGQDLSVDEQVQNTAGAVNYVSRHYKNQENGQEVRLWLIVGHSRDICRHTPNICYPNAGFRQDGQQLHHSVKMPSGEDAKFFTGKFIKDDAFGRHAERVFWAWTHPDVEEFGKKWEAPEDPRKHYGLSRALYKVYFTSSVLTEEKVVGDNVAAEFAELMLPEINKALFPETNPAATVDEAEGVGEEEEAEATETNEDTPAEETASSELETSPAE